MTEDNNNIDLRNGLADVIGLDWLRMFSSKELSTLVAGAEHEINVSDLQVCPLTLTPTAEKTKFTLKIHTKFTPNPQPKGKISSETIV